MKLLQLLFPPKCVFCKAILAQGEAEICEKCLDSIPLSIKLRSGEFFRAAVSALEYGGNVRDALHRFKYNGKQNYAVPLAKTVDFALRSRPDWEFDVIVAVPTTRKNLRRRGYNHAALLAREVSKLQNRAFVDALEKCRETEPMFGLSSAERRANVLGSILVARGADELSGARVLLVDDIITTGSTVSECSRMLLEAGAREIFCAAVATGTDKR